MLGFIFAIIGLLVIIAIISMLADFQNSAIECILGIVGIFVIYALVTGGMNFMFWLGYQIGPGYAILIIILLIVCPILLWYLYNKSKSNQNNANNNRYDYNYNYTVPKYESTLESKICPKCGRKFDKDVKKCSYCGYKFE